MAFAIDGCCMFSIVSFGAEREVVGRCQPPMPGSGVGISDYIETEILAMIILVVGKIVEQHAAIHLLNIFTALCDVARECEKI